MPAYNDSIPVSVTDPDGDLKFVTIFAEWVGAPREVVYASAAGGEPVGEGVFGTYYTGSARSAVADGWTYTLARAGGWPSTAVIVTVNAIDDTGELTVTSHTYAITRPAPAGSPGRPSVDVRARQLGKDIAFDEDFHVGPHGDWQTVEGVELIRQAVFHRLITSPGEFAARPEYGVGIEACVKEEMTEAVLAELKTKIRTQLLQDRRISRCDVALKEFDDSGAGVEVTISLISSGQALTLAPFVISRDGVTA